ncbi:putative E3 ubiquitin-protein ligase ARI9 [Hypsibius exemplaris]|uniref:RBR-type E3 ubiquitin transferase n=1 Tax=Hypsibius exemplaris TaxID=2072580 RepID=A0A9X6RPN8_HYPEX|nr:putative E3 ubiquitin-protein ligase ARI9 [Hypsibius exemplaris]
MPSGIRRLSNVKDAFIEKLCVCPTSKRQEIATKPNPPSRSLETFWKNDAKFQSVLGDGGLRTARFFTGSAWEIMDADISVPYSLNKRKRWLLPELLGMAMEQLPRMDFAVSCLVRSMPEPSYRYSYTHGVGHFREIVPVVISMTDYPVRETAPLRASSLRRKRYSHLRDYPINSPLPVNSTTKGDIKSIDANRSDLPRQIDLGIMYHVGIPAQYGQMAKQRPKPPQLYEDNYLRRRPRKREKVDRHRKQRRATLSRATLSREVEDDLDCHKNLNEATIDQPMEILDTVFRRTYDFAELLESSLARPTKRHFTREEAKSSKSSNAKSLIVYGVMASVPPDSDVVSEHGSVSEVLASSIRFRADQDSQRTFHLNSGTLEELSTRLNAVGSKSMADGDLTITFLDVGLNVAVVLTARRMQFGLELTVKGPTSWLKKLPEFTDLHDVSVILSPQTRCLKNRVSTPSSLEVSLAFPGSCIELTNASSRIPVAEGPCLSRLSDDFPCPICFEDVSEILANVCGHYACASCWKIYITATVSEGTTGVKCPISGCEISVGSNITALTAPWHALEAWQTRMNDAWVTEAGGKYCPTSGCSGIFLPILVQKETAPLNGMMTRTLCRCRSCSRLYCWSCLEEWHWPSSCSAADSYRQLLVQRDDDPWLRYFKQTLFFAKTKRCPTCRLPVEKGLGCNHMSCVCGAAFCWNCARLMSAHYNEDNNYKPCLEKALDIINVEKGVNLGLRDEAYGIAVDFRKRRRDWSRRPSLDADMKTQLFFLYHVTEYVFAHESQLPYSRRSSFGFRTAAVDLVFMCDMIAAHFEDRQRREIFVKRAKQLVLEFSAAIRSMKP